MADAQDAGRVARIARGALALYVALVAGIHVVTLLINDGVYSYNMDDAYIHMELARHLANGEHAFNAGEFSAPSSSALWPLLLVPSWWVGGSWYAPLVVNALAGLVAILGFAAVAARALGDHPAAPWLVAAMVFVPNLAPLTHTGMEHVLQVALTAWFAVGLIDVSRGERLAWWWVPVAIAMPLIRFECTGIVLLGAVWVGVRGMRGPAVATLAGVGATITAYVTFLQAHTGHRLPNSILSRKAMFGSAWEELLQPHVGVLVLVALALAWQLRNRSPLAHGPAWIAVAGTVGHLAIGGANGGFGRYIAYILTFTVLVLVWTMRDALVTTLEGENRRVVLWAVLLLVLPTVRVHAFDTLNAGHIWREQGQMRAIADAVDGPVGVNDIGWVAVGNDHYVLDLVGLANTEALNHLLDGDPQEVWLGELARDHDVSMVMIFRHWFDDLPKGWVHVATLHADWFTEKPERRRVEIHATSADAVGPLVRVLEGVSVAQGARLELE